MFMFMLHGILACLDVNNCYVGMSYFVMRPTYRNRNCCNFFDAYFVVYNNWIGFYCKTLCSCLNWFFTQGVKSFKGNFITYGIMISSLQQNANFVDLIEEIWKWVRLQMSLGKSHFMKCGAQKSRTQHEGWIVVRWETFSLILVL